MPGVRVSGKKSEKKIKGTKDSCHIRDIIVEIEGQSGMTQDEFVALIRGKMVGDSIEIKYWRGGEYYTTTLVLADLNSLGGENIGGEADYNFFGE